MPIEPTSQLAFSCTRSFAECEQGTFIEANRSSPYWHSIDESASFAIIDINDEIGKTVARYFNCYRK